MSRGGKRKPDAPEILNRKARHQFQVEETLEVGVALVGTEVKSLRDGQGSLGEGYVRAELTPPSLTLVGVHIAEYPPAGSRQHEPTRPRRLLAHKREIERLAGAASASGVTIVPLKLYFKNGRAKVLIGVARAKKHADRRQDVRQREAQKEIRRAMSKRV